MTSPTPAPGDSPLPGLQAELDALAAAAAGTPAGHALDLLRQAARHYAALARGESGTEQFTRLLAISPLRWPGPGAADPAAIAAWQGALQAVAAFVATAAQDAAARLARALEAQGPEAAPITNLKALFDLSVECGEAAWAEVARRDDYADAQAGLLHAIARLRAGRDAG